MSCGGQRRIQNPRRMRMKSISHAGQAVFLSKLGGCRQKRSVAPVHAIENTDGHGAGAMKAGEFLVAVEKLHGLHVQGATHRGVRCLEDAFG